MDTVVGLEEVMILGEEEGGKEGSKKRRKTAQVHISKRALPKEF